MDCRRAARWAGYVSYSGARGACRFCSEPIVTGLRTGLASVRFATGPKRSMGHFLGAEKEIFLSRDIDDATRAGASVESCRFVVLRYPGGRFRSVVDVGKRLHRTRGGFHRCIHISKVLCALLLWTMICQRFRSRALWRAPSASACGVGGYPLSELPP